MISKALIFITRTTILFYLFISTSNLFAQEGKINQIKDSRIDRLIEKQIEINQTKKKINGYRVQIHFGVQREPAKEVKGKFLLKCPNTEAYEIYQQPHFKIRVGDFRTKLDAYRFLKQIQQDFPNSFIVQDEVEIASLIN